MVTGEVGSGKSTALRGAAYGLHPSEYKPLSVTATSGAITELYRQIVSPEHVRIASTELI